jgi:predicted GNAT superfamily acetyltransferase
MGLADLEIIPYQILQSFAGSGGAVIGAFDGAFGGAELIGFAAGYTGLLEDGTPYHRSQRLAMAPAFRGQGAGEALKRAQADHVRRYGLRLMCWTFDPLLSRNAHLNLHKLGATSRRYVENAYVYSSSWHHTGVSLDRLWVEWGFAEQTTDSRQQTTDEFVAGASVVLAMVDDRPARLDLKSAADVVVIQVPDDIDSLRARDLDLVRAWREATRAAFQHYFGRGYRAVDFIRRKGYILAKAEG